MPVGSTPAAAPAPDAAVRKTVTVLFADLGGSTSFGERTDAELAREVMARYHALLQEVVDAHGGTVAKFMGDGMMATFGIPEIAEDDASRAVRAGSELQQRFFAFATEVADRHRETLTLRVGINTGEVVIADGDADLIGDALNVAARLEKACRPGHVLVGDATWRITRGEFDFEALGDVSVAGRAAPVAIYEVAAADVTSVDPVAPFVGRTLEMQRLQSTFERAATSRTALLVTVLGSPGLGKTRLSRELANRVTAEADAAAFEIRCDREGEATFAPIAQLIREAAGIGDDTEADAADARERIAELFPTDEDDRERLVDVLAGVFGAAPARSVEETFWSIRRLVESLAASRPLMIVIDDIQWAEPKLLDLLEHLAEWVSDAAVLLVCLARPELRDVRPVLAETSRRVTDVLALDGLDSAATEQLAAGLLGTERLPAGLIERLPASTDGNPLFVRELVRMLVDDDVIRRRDDGAWELTIDADAVEVPPTIQSLLAARVERLPAEERRLLELASVIGAEFSLGALRDLAGAAVSVPSLLEGMRRKELVEPTGTYWGDEPVHRFHHVLIRDAAYRRLLKTTRADLHQRVGEWTDASAANLIGEHEASIAYHYEQAYAYRRELGAMDADSERLGSRAAELLSIAAQRALGRDDLTSAGALARRAVVLVPGDDTAARSELLLVACECFLASGDVTAGAPVVRELAEVAAGNEQLAAWAARFEAQLVGLVDPQGLLAAEATASAAAETLQTLGDGAGEAKAHQVRAGLLARLGRVGDAEAVLELALEAARAVNDRRRVTAVLGAAPLAALFGPSPVARAGGRCLDVVRLLRITTASPSVEATSTRCQAVLEALRGRFDVSRSMLASARESLVELGLRHGLLETELFTGMVELLADDPGAAIAPLRAAYEGLGTLGVGADAGQAAALLARALLQQGDVDAADRMATASEELAGQNLKTAIAWRVARAEVLAARGDLTAALAIGDEAAQIAAATDLILDHADACVAVMRLRELADDATGARAARAEALRLYEAKGATVPAQRLGSTAEDLSPPVRAAAAAKPSDRSTERRTPHAENASAAMLERLWSLIVAGRHEEVGSLSSDDVVYIDHRSMVHVEVRGRDNLLANNRVLAQLGLDFARVEVLAVRGSRLSLARMTGRFADSSELVALEVLELDDDGLASRHVFFDEDDLDAAIDELDARFLAGEGAEHADVYRNGFESLRMHRALDWEAVRESLTDDFVLVDHRELGVGECDRDRFIAFVSAGAPEQRELAVVIRKLHRVGQSLLVTFRSSITRAGTAYEWVFHGLTAINASGRVERMEWFGEDDFDRALARLDELGAVDPRTPLAQNASAAMFESLWGLIVAGRHEEFGALCTDDVALIDRRSIVAEEGYGRENLLTSNHALVELGLDFARVEMLAVRGSRLSLGRVTVRFGGSSEIVALQVVELDNAGLLSRNVFFNEDDLNSALDELDERYLQGEGAEHTHVLRPAQALLRAAQSNDFDAIQDLLSPDFVSVDHRPLAFGDNDRDHFLSAARTITEIGLVEVSTLFRTVHVVGRAVLAAQRGRRVTERGSKYEWTGSVVALFDTSSRACRIEYFAEDDFDVALARLDELGGGESRVPLADNAMWRQAERLLACFNARDFDRARSLLAEDFARFDRRRGVSAPTADGRDAYIDAAGAWYDVGFDEVVAEPLAVRGNTLMLAKSSYHAADGREVAFLVVYELDGHGLIARGTHFDEDDLEAALDELDDRYLEGEGAAHLELLAVGRAFVDATRCDDFEAMRGFLAPDFVAIDHEPLGFGRGDRDYYIAASRTRTQVAADGVDTVLSLEAVENALLTTLLSRAITPEGSEYEAVSCILMVTDDSRRISRLEWFPLDQYAEARARLDELGAVDPTWPPYLDNAVLRSIMVGGRADTTAFADDLVVDDRRSGVSLPQLHGSEEAIQASRVQEELFGATVMEPVAIRGDRLALVRTRSVAESGFELVAYGIFEHNVAGRLCAMVFFDESDLTTALDELDARFVAGEGAAHLAVRSIGGMFSDAARRGDFDAMGNLLAPDFVMVDHQILGFGEGDRDYLIEVGRTRTQGAADGNRMVLSLRTAKNALLSVTVSPSITDEGSEYERLECVLMFVDESRRISRMEWFTPERYVEALTGLHELAAAAAPELENGASRSARTMVRLAAAGDVDGSAALVTDDFEHVSRRSVVSSDGYRGRDAFIKTNKAGFEAFPEVIGPEVIAIRGDRLVLIRVGLRARNGFEVMSLGLYETDAAGAIAFWATFDEDDPAAALDELNERYIAGEGAEHEYLIRRLAENRSAFEARDWDAYEALIHPEFAFVDHRRIGQGSGNRDGLLTSLRALTELAPAFTSVEPSLLIKGDVSLTRVRDRATNTEGTEYEWEHFVVQQFVAGLVIRTELFPLDAYAEARACLDVLAKEPRTPHADNAVARALARRSWLGRFEPAYDRLAGYHPDCVLVDRRRNVNAGELAGREEVDASINSGIDVFGALVIESIAVRGERLLLVTWRFEQEGGFNTAGLSVAEADELLRTTAIISFDEDDLASAVAELESRHRALSGDAYRAADAFVTACETGTARLTPDVASRLASVCAKSYSCGNVVLSVWPVYSSYCVTVLDDEGQATSCEFFGEHEWGDALTRFDELSAPQPG